MIVCNGKKTGVVGNDICLFWYYKHSGRDKEIPV